MPPRRPLRWYDVECSFLWLSLQVRKHLLAGCRHFSSEDGSGSRFSDVERLSIHTAKRNIGGMTMNPCMDATRRLPVSIDQPDGTETDMRNCQTALCVKCESVRTRPT